MKKIFTLMASALLTATAMAAPVAPRIEPVKVSDEAIARSQMRLDRLVNDIENNREVPGLEKHDVTINGLEFTAYLLSHGPATRVANGWEWGERLYDIDFILSSKDKEVSEYYVMSVLWPTQTIVSLFEDGEDNMKIDNTMVPVSEMLQFNSENWVPFQFIFAQPGYVNIASFTDDRYVDGWFAYSAGGKKENKAIAGVNKGAYVAVKDLSIEGKTEDVNMRMEVLGAAYDENKTNTVIGTIDVNYNGDISWMEGFIREHRTFEINQIHIAYTGEKFPNDRDNNIKGNWNYYDLVWPKMKRYYINMCNENMTYSANQWSGTTYPHYHAASALKLGAENNPAATTDDPDAMLAFVQGSLWTPTDKETFYYLDYTQVKSDIEYPRIFNTPEPYTTQEAWANAFDFALWDGMTGAYNSRYTDWYEVHLSIGGVDGMVFKAEDSYRNTYEATMKSGNIYFHNDPEHLETYEMKPVVRPDDIMEILSEGTFVSAANGMIKVYCDGVKNVTVYNVAGAMVNNAVVDGAAEFAAAPGVYVVKVGEKSYKVML